MSQPSFSRGKVVLFSLVPVLVVLAILEILGRVLYPLDPDARARIQTRRDPRVSLSYLGTPGVSAFRIIEDTYRIEHRYLPFVGWIGKPHTDLPTIKNNELGFRDRRVEARKPYEIRILVLGGSTAWGLGASSTEATVPGALERILNRTGSTGSYRVMSGAFSGWAGRQERVAAVELFGVFQPDLVVALTGYNDVLGMVDGSSHVFLQRPEAAELGRAVEDQLRPMTTWRALRKLGGTLGVWRLVVYVREAVTVGNPTGGRTAYDPSIAAQEIPRLVDLYTDLAGFLDRRGRRLLVALQPDLYSARKPLTEEEQGVRRRFVSRAPDFEPTFRRYREELVSALLAARGNGFSALDLGGVFDAHAGPVFIDDCHFNDEGYRVIAEALAQPIRAAR